MARQAASAASEGSGAGSTVAAIMRAHNWSASPLGPPEGWPQSLQTAVGIILGSGHPMAIAWGPKFAALYNDAYRPILGATKHPRALGLPMAQVFPETWAEVGPIFERVVAEATEIAAKDQRFILDREGQRQEGYFDFACSPIRDESGAVGGVLVICSETTERVLNERRLHNLFDLAPALIAVLRGPDLRFQYANPAARILVGSDTLPGRAIREALPGLDEKILALLDRVYATGEPFVGTEVAVGWLRDGIRREGYFNFSCQPTYDAGDRIDGLTLHGVDVTMQVRARHAAEGAERRLTALLEQLPIGVLIAEAPSGRIVQGNARLEAILGHPVLPSPTVAEYGEWIGFHPDGRRVRGDEWPLARAVRGETVAAQEYHYQRGDGEKIWIRISGAPIRDESGAIVAGVVAVTDIAEERAAATALRESEARLQQALQAGGFGSWQYNFASGTFELSAEGLTLFGLSTAGDADAARINERFAPETLAEIQAGLNRAIAEQRDYTADHSIHLPDGTQRWIAIHGRPSYTADGVPLTIIGTIQDVTARKETEDELARLLADERAARVEAEEAVRARDTFLSIAAHELRTPVTALKGTAQLILRWQGRDQLTEERLTRNLDVLWRSADRLASLTEDLLDVSRIRTGQLTLELHPTRLQDLITEAVGRQREQNTDGHLFGVHSPPDLAPLPADAGRIEQVLTNLLDNAVKYSPNGGTITITARDDDGGVAVEVRDQGIGLPPGTGDAIFVPFGRASNAAASSLPGMGLGLYICRTIVERHGGWIRAESAGEGLGTTVTFWLPREHLPASS